MRAALAWGGLLGFPVYAPKLEAHGCCVGFGDPDYAAVLGSPHPVGSRAAEVTVAGATTEPLLRLRSLCNLLPASHDAGLGT